MQDIVGDSFDTLKSVKLLETANLSLNELVLQNIIFNYNEEDDVVENEVGIIKN